MFHSGGQLIEISHSIRFLGQTLSLEAVLCIVVKFPPYPISW